MRWNQEDDKCQKGKVGGGGGVVVALSHKNAGRTFISVLEREGVRWNQEDDKCQKGKVGGGGG